MPKPGDKCPRCGEGLVLRTEMGLECEECPWNETTPVGEEAIREHFAPPADFKERTFSITISDPEAGEEFLRGLIVARTNNSSEYFVDLIEAVNTILQPWREKVQAAELQKRAKAGMA